MRLPSIEGSGPGRQAVYRQIAGHIRREIEAGALRAGARLPPIRALATDIGVNRDTVALAYESLAGEGLLESVVGRGTFVRGLSVAAKPRALVDLPLADSVEGLLAYENARPRFGVAADAVPLHSLVPDPAFYPVNAFRRVLNQVLAREGAELLRYGSPQGRPGLRQILALRLQRGGGRVSTDDIVLCHGASQGIALALRLFAQSGDCVAVEVPTYHNVLATLVALGLRPAGIAQGPDGPDLEQLERTLQRPDVKAFYTIPTFHNPMGTTTSLGARQRILEIAARAGVPVIEDGFETDLRCFGREIPTLAALDRHGLVVQLSSFSKSLFPGVRVGAIAATGRAIDGLLALKRSTDLSDAMPLQAALEAFVRSGAYDRHLVRIRRMLRARTEAILDALAREMPAGTTFTRPEGGYQVWVELPFEVDSRDLLADAAREGVLFAPGSQFLPEGGPSRGLRLTLARADEDEIRRGVAILGRVAKRFHAAGPTALDAAAVNM